MDENERILDGAKINAVPMHTADPFGPDEPKTSPEKTS
jgi:hypothetical protein